MQCETDAGDIKKEDDGFELEDVFCAEGQYDIDPDADFNVTNEKHERSLVPNLRQSAMNEYKRKNGT